MFFVPKMLKIRVFFKQFEAYLNDLTSGYAKKDAETTIDVGKIRQINPRIWVLNPWYRSDRKETKRLYYDYRNNHPFQPLLDSNSAYVIEILGSMGKQVY